MTSIHGQINLGEDYPIDQGLQRRSASYGKRELATRSELAKPQTSRNVPLRTVYLTGETTGTITPPSSNKLGSTPNVNP